MTRPRALKPAPPTPSLHDLGTLAEAYEVARIEVLDDAWLVATWTNSESTLLDSLARRHGWDPSVPPSYVASLRRAAASAGRLR